MKMLIQQKNQISRLCHYISSKARDSFSYFIMCCRLSAEAWIRNAASVFSFIISSHFLTSPSSLAFLAFYWGTRYINLSSTENKQPTHTGSTGVQEEAARAWERARAGEEGECNIIWMRNSVARVFNVVYSVLSLRKLIPYTRWICWLGCC